MSLVMLALDLTTGERAMLAEIARERGVTMDEYVAALVRASAFERAHRE